MKKYCRENWVEPIIYKSQTNAIIAQKVSHLHKIRGDKIGYDPWTQHDTTRHDIKLVGYGLRLNGFVSYSSWYD